MKALAVSLLVATVVLIPFNLLMALATSAAVVVVSLIGMSMEED